MPSLTRSIDIALTATRATGENDGYADNISLILLLTGDYNQDGTVDAADYSVWRDSLGTTGDFLAADGNGNGAIDAGDYDVWNSTFGHHVDSGAGARQIQRSPNQRPSPCSSWE